MASNITETAAIVGKDWVWGSYYDEAERATEFQWPGLIWPIIGESDFSTTLELAAGHGRNTAKLLEHAGRLYAIDINQSNIDFLNQRFQGVDKLTTLQNSGADLTAIANASVTFVYCFDAMVHFDSDVVRAYIQEFRRVMKPGARAFIHYSAYDKNPTGTYRDHPGWRNFMNPALFHHWLAKEGFQILKSAYILGTISLTDDPENADGITFFELPRDAEPSGAEKPRAMEAQISAFELRVAELEDRLAKSGIALQDSERRRRMMEESASWKLTAPMRKIRDTLAG